MCHICVNKKGVTSALGISKVLVSIFLFLKATSRAGYTAYSTIKKQEVACARYSFPVYRTEYFSSMLNMLNIPQIRSINEIIQN